MVEHHSGVFVGILISSSEAVVVTEQGTAISTRTAPRWDGDGILSVRALSWSPDGSDIRHSRWNGEACRGGASPPGRSADGRQNAKDLPSQFRL